MASKLFPCLAAIAFAAILFNFFSKRRSSEINGGNGQKRRICENEGVAGGASSPCTSTEGQEMATSLGHDYEVFLSFKGDTRSGFTNFLYTSMIDMGIRVYKDDENLQKGEEFWPALCQAIEQSRISIPIFSKGYASSVWCLKELVKMVECQKTKGQKIMPIFYDVAPKEVRYQIGGYKDAFDSYKKKKRHGEETMREWKAALKEVSFLNGGDLSQLNNRREGEFVRKLTHEVFNKLKKAYLLVSDYLVNVDNHVDAIMEKIGTRTSETCIIGIHGMGGIGKSTIAKLIYNKLLHEFENCCFLHDIREKSTRDDGIQCLQNQLISDIFKKKDIFIKDINEGTQTIKDRLSNKRVLLLLDDVEMENQIDALVGKRDRWGRGSKIIITTRNKDILYPPKVDYSYEVSGMDLDQSLKLFSKHAFRYDSPLDDDYKLLSHRAIGIAGGLPLTLEVLGSLLGPIEKKKWNLMLDKLENVPHEKVQSKLKISYDALDFRQQHIFLDIACLFIGYDKDIVVLFSDESNFPEEAMEVLQNMSLIKIEKDNIVWMHDQLRDLGREIVRQESKTKIEKRSRVWDPKEALDLLRRPEGIKEVEALHLKFDRKGQYHFTYKGFKSLSNLKFLAIDGSMEYFRVEERLLWHESSSNVLPIDVFQENLDLLPKLRWLSWHKIPPTFNITNFSMEDVVILDLSRSEITQDWKGWSHMEVMKNLKVLNLTDCVCLERTPDLLAHSKLERLILQGCCKLVEIDMSICQLESLVFLDVRNCGNLWSLPDKLCSDLASLKYLYLSNCNLLKRLPDTIGNLKSLNELDISRTAIEEIPSSIGNLKNLKIVKMNDGATSKIPDALWTIEKLEVLEVKTLFYIFNVEIGNCISRNRSLRTLKLDSSRIYKLPRLPESLINLKLYVLYMDMFPDLSNLTNLEKLELCFQPPNSDGESKEESEGSMEKYLPWWIGNLSKLELLFLKSPYVTALPTDIRSLLPRLKSLLLNCPNLHCLPSLPSSLSSLNLNSVCMTTLPADTRSLLPQLSTLKLRCRNLCCLPSLPSTLSFLELDSECLTTLPTNMSSLLPRLGFLWLRCPNLRCLPSLPSSLHDLLLDDCKSCCSMEDLSNLKTLSYLKISGCAISKIRGLDCLENQGTLYLSELQQVEILPDLSNLNELDILIVDDCGNLVEIQGKLPPSLEVLRIRDCESLQKLPNLSSLKALQIVQIKGCGKLNVEAISSLCLEKGVKFE